MAEPVTSRGLLSVEEYLELEESATVKHEYVGGVIHAMTGATKLHNRIAGRIYRRLSEAAEGGSCRVYMSDVKLQAPGDVFYYPDVMVACGPEEGNSLIEKAPCLVVEVVSPSTESIDRREKLQAYRSIPSLGAYLIFDQEQRRVERHWRGEDGLWRRAELSGEGSFPVPCPETELSLDGVYEGL